MSKNQSCVNTCEHYEERSRHGARAHHREGSDVCKQCAAAAAAAGRISRHGFDPWVEATGAPTWQADSPAARGVEGPCCAAGQRGMLGACVAPPKSPQQVPQLPQLGHLLVLGSHCLHSR